MKLNFSTYFLIVAFLTCIFQFPSNAQSSKRSLNLSKKSNQKKVKMVEPASYFKLKTTNGTKVKGKFDTMDDDFFISNKNDTVFFEEIFWIKAKTELSRLGKAAAITGVFGGTYFSFGTVPMALYFIVMEGTFWVVFAPVATISAAVFGIRMLGGRRYKMSRWNLQTTQNLS